MPKTLLKNFFLESPKAFIGIATLLVLSTAVAATIAEAQTLTVAPGDLRSYSTIYSIGVEWDLVGDANHDAGAAVEFRPQGSAVWKPALPLVRIDYNGANMLAGSIFFLTPGTDYDVRISLSDPDGGAETRIVTVSTRPLPALPIGGRTFHVVPGAGGGDGSAGNPFRGVEAAQAVGRPGDIFLFHVGSYGGRIRFGKPGTAADYIVWKAAGDGEVSMDGLDIAASHIWLEGITVHDQAHGVLSIDAPENVVVTRSNFFNNHYSIYLYEGGKDWYIADNTIVGDTPASSESFGGEGIELNRTGGHTVAHNSITNVADGISYPLSNVDIFGNDIFDTSDDGIEADFGLANIRMWGNRIHNAVHNGISFQPQYGGPWYIIRNQIVNNKEAPFKFRTTDRFVLLHNTIVNWGSAWPGDKMMCCNDQHSFGAIARNNLWISVQGGQIWGFGNYSKDWRTDLETDGFDWGTATNPFSYGGVTYPDLSSFAAGSGLETHGIRVSKEICFETFDVPGPSPASVPPQVMTLRATCNAVDGGAPLPNIAEDFTGAGPDLGAYEYGRAPPHFGPRTAWGSPSAPADLAATAVSSSQIDLRWADTSEDEDGFLVEQSTDGISFVRIAVLGENATRFSITNLAPATSYTFRVAAFKAEEPPVLSGTATATTLQVSLGAPTGLQAVATDRHIVNLSWTDNSSSEAGFEIARSTNGKSFRQIAKVGANVSTFSDRTARANRTYTYRVRAYRPTDTSPYSNAATATTPRK
ncbi:MAG: right-handed parallel beta-helix repeat-containing protein [Deltaproteobacteria bacterium]|nr:right-handed parallel beta-helix repeat-containing protein [Deltaproteobacteria bacterium]